MARLSVWRHVTVEIDGRDYTGSYAVQDEMLHVHFNDLKKVTQIGGSHAPSLARLLLRELVAESENGR